MTAATQILMDQELQNLIQRLCLGFPTHDVNVSQIFDMRRFARMVHYAWKNEIGFHPEMFKNALKETDLFGNLSEEVLDAKSAQLCHQSDLAKGVLHAAFDIEKLSI